MKSDNKTLFTGVTTAGLRILTREDGSDSRTIEGYAIVFGERSVPLWREKGKEVVEVIDAEAISAELLDRSDIKMTMYHDMGRLLARSKKGQGTLSYEIDDRGVKFRFDAPDTSYGDEALALVRTGDIDGCSFMFATKYGDKDHVSREETDDQVVYHVRKILGVYDFTLTPDPAYPQTECEARSAATEAEKEEREAPKWDSTQYREMLKQTKY